MDLTLAAKACKHLQLSICSESGVPHINARLLGNITLKQLTGARPWLRRGQLPKRGGVEGVSDGSDDLIASREQLADEFEADATRGSHYTPRGHAGRASLSREEVQSRQRGETGRNEQGEEGNESAGGRGDVTGRQGDRRRASVLGEGYI